MIHPSPETLAAEFWAGTDLHDVFPRKIEQVIALKLPLALVGLSPLTVAAIGHWLQQRDIARRLPTTGAICAAAWSPTAAVASSSSATPTHRRTSG